MPTGSVAGTHDALEGQPGLWTDWLIAASIAIMFAPTFRKLAAYGWRSADYTYAYFILPISLWLLSRMRLSRSDGLPAPGVALCVLGFFSYLFGAQNDFMFLEALAFVVMVWGVCRIRLTCASFHRARFPLAYLLFLVPPPILAIDAVTLPLKAMSAWGSYLLLRLCHLPVALHGMMLKVGQHDILISEGCSGFRSMSALLALGAFYAYHQPVPRSAKWLIGLSVVPLGILGNVVRISLTAVVVHWFGARYGEGVSHTLSGLVLFPFTLAGLMAVTELVSRRFHVTHDS